MYKHVISLGWFCGPAMELEKVGLRDASYPFDWLLTHDFKNVILSIKEKKIYNLKLGNMLQYEKVPSHWYNKEYIISLFHDFSEYEYLEKQLPAVNAKYARRFARFYTAIQEPTLFIRYVKDKDELHYIYENEEKINQILQRYNGENVIKYIVHRDIMEDLNVGGKNNKFIYVSPDKNDILARSFFDQCDDFKTYLIQNVSAQYLENNKKHNSVKKKKVKRNAFTKIFKRRKDAYPKHKEGILERME